MRHDSRMSDAVYFIDTDKLPQDTELQRDFKRDLLDDRIDRVEITRDDLFRETSIVNAIVNLPAVVERLVALKVTK